MFTKEQRPTRVYKVFFEHIPTGNIDYLYLEGTSSEEVSRGLLAMLGKDYDLLKSISVKAADLN
jgi:hypothetical protein